MIYRFVTKSPGNELSRGLRGRSNINKMSVGVAIAVITHGTGNVTLVFVPTINNRIIN